MREKGMMGGRGKKRGRMDLRTDIAGEKGRWRNIHMDIGRNIGKEDGKE